MMKRENSKQILILSHPQDSHALSVQRDLELMGRQASIVDTSEIGVSSEIHCHLDDGGLTYTIMAQGDTFSSSSVCKVWYRRIYRPNFTKKMLPEVKKYNSQEFLSVIQSVHLSSPTDLVFPHIQPMISGSNKLKQLIHARKAGLTVPKTTIGNSFEGANKVDSESLLIKSYDSPFISFFDSESDQSFRISTKSRKKSTHTLAREKKRLSVCPVIIQEYIPKQYELRITIVGDIFFCAGIDTQGNPESVEDSRMSGQTNLRHWEEVLPAEIVAKLKSYMKSMEMNFACIDMIVSPDNEYVFLESNPNGQWLWIQEKTGMKISEAIARELAR